MSSESVAVEVRRLAPGEVGLAFEVMRELRTHLDRAEFLARVGRLRAGGYELLGAFRAGELVGVLGMRPVETLARGRHLHVDDLVIREGERGHGIGRTLLEYAEQDAVRRGLTAVFLDSRQEALGFYTRLGYELHPAPLVRKRFG